MIKAHHAWAVILICLRLRCTKKIYLMFSVHSVTAKPETALSEDSFHLHFPVICLIIYHMHGKFKVSFSTPFILVLYLCYRFWISAVVRSFTYPWVEMCGRKGMVDKTLEILSQDCAFRTNNLFWACMLWKDKNVIFEFRLRPRASILTRCMKCNYLPFWIILTDFRHKCKCSSS